MLLLSVTSITSDRKILLGSTFPAAVYSRRPSKHHVIALDRNIIVNALNAVVVALPPLLISKHEIEEHKILSPTTGLSKVRSIIVSEGGFDV
jgi:hypothetical protein